MASDSADTLHSTAHYAAEDYSRDRRHNNGFLTNTLGLCAAKQPTEFALLESLPWEILIMILEAMDLKSLWALAATNQHLRGSICSVPVIRGIQESYTVSYALRRLIQADAGNTITIVDFKNVLKSKACTTCHEVNEFATLLDLATCERLCFPCSELERTRPRTQLVRLQFLGCYNGTVQFRGGRLCEGCDRDNYWNPSPDGESQTRAKRAYLEDQFLEHFSKCETAWKITAGQRMRRHDEWWLCVKLDLEYDEAWDTTSGNTLPARDFRAAVHELRYGKELTPPAFRTEYARLKRIACIAKRRRR